jgi:hypothetical protein
MSMRNVKELREFLEDYGIDTRVMFDLDPYSIEWIGKSLSEIRAEIEKAEDSGSGKEFFEKYIKQLATEPFIDQESVPYLEDTYYFTFKSREIAVIDVDPGGIDYFELGPLGTGEALALMKDVSKGVEVAYPLRY